MDQLTAAMKSAFDTRLQELLGKKHKHIQILSEDEYTEMIRKVKKAKRMKTNKKPGDYARLKKYDIMKKDGKKRLIVPGSGDQSKTDTLYYIYSEEIFDVLHKAYQATNHGTKERLLQEVKKYKNITREMVSLYLNVYEEKRNCPINDLIKANSNIRIIETVARKSYFEFIEMPEDNGYKFIFMHEDCDTKFIQLRPCKTQTAKEAAKILFKIYSIFGESNVFKCRYGKKKLCKEVFAELKVLWPSLHLMPIERASPPFMGPDEYSCQTPTEMVLHILKHKQRSPEKWVEELPLVQLIKNTSFDYEVGCEPYDAMFRKDRCRNTTSFVPYKKYPIDDSNILEDETDTSSDDDDGDDGDDDEDDEDNDEVNDEENDEENDNDDNEDDNTETAIKIRKIDDQSSTTGELNNKSEHENINKA